MESAYHAGVDRYNEPILTPFDAGMPHMPHDYLQDLPRDLMTKIKKRIRTCNFGKLCTVALSRFSHPARYSYADAVAKAFHDLPDDPRFLPGVMPGWDNTPVPPPGASCSRARRLRCSRHTCKKRWTGSAVGRPSRRSFS